MPKAKIEFKFGTFSFSGEGDEGWLAKQLDKVLERASQLSQIAVPSEMGQGADVASSAGAITKVNLASYLTSKNAISNQTRKFLATAAWLQLRGRKRTSTGDVTKALRDSNQSRLGNPADCLAKNVKKGHCEKDGTQFFVTVDGLKALQ